MGRRQSQGKAEPASSRATGGASERHAAPAIAPREAASASNTAIATTAAPRETCSKAAAQMISREAAHGLTRT